MKRLMLLTLILLISVGILRPAPTQAQPMNMPLLMLISGDIWTWNPQTDALVQLTTWGYNFKPVMSPNGDWVAYKSWATITVEAINNNAPMNPGEPAGNIWLLDPFTGDALRIADQPDGAVFADVNGNDNYIARSNPTWSPDGSEIAWTQFHVPSYTSELVIYNLANQTTRVVVSDLPVGYEQQGPADVEWGALGFMYLAYNYDQAIEGFVATYSFYDVNGNNYNTINIPANDTPTHDEVWFTGTEFVNGMDNGIAVINSTDLPTLIDPLTNNTVDFMGLLVGYSAWQSLTQGNYVSFSTYTVDFTYGLIWSAQSSDGRYLGDIGTSLSYFDTFAKLAISPDGLSVAYVAEDGSVLVWQNGLTVQLPVSNVEAITWSPVMWTTNYPVGG